MGDEKSDERREEQREELLCQVGRESQVVCVFE